MALDIDLDELTFDNIGSWPLPVKIVACVFAFTFILIAAYYLDTANQIDQLEVDKRKETVLRREFENKQQQSASLQAYKLQLAEIRRSFGALLRQLPSKTEVPGLLEDISKSGVASGLEFKLFDPAQEVRHDFYAELPIRITVTGNYHQLGDFVSRVAGLDRIVTLHDFRIYQAQAKAIVTKKPDEKAKEDAPTKQLLTMEMTAKTYRYIDSEDIGNQAAKKPGAKK